MTKLRAVEDRFIEMIDGGVVDGEVHCSVDCHNYDTYKKLPKIVEMEAGSIKSSVGGNVPYGQVRLGLTGWNSDTGRAYYYQHGVKQYLKGYESLS